MIYDSRLNFKRLKSESSCLFTDTSRKNPPAFIKQVFREDIAFQEISDFTSDFNQPEPKCHEMVRLQRKWALWGDSSVIMMRE